MVGGDRSSSAGPVHVPVRHQCPHAECDKVYARACSLVRHIANKHEKTDSNVADGHGSVAPANESDSGHEDGEDDDGRDSLSDVSAANNESEGSVFGLEEGEDADESDDESSAGSAGGSNSNDSGKGIGSRGSTPSLIGGVVCICGKNEDDGEPVGKCPSCENLVHEHCHRDSKPSIGTDGFVCLLCEGMGPTQDPGGVGASSDSDPDATGEPPSNPSSGSSASGCGGSQRGGGRGLAVTGGGATSSAGCPPLSPEVRQLSAWHRSTYQTRRGRGVSRNLRHVTSISLAVRVASPRVYTADGWVVIDRREEHGWLHKLRLTFYEAQ